MNKLKKIVIIATFSPSLVTAQAVTHDFVNSSLNLPNNPANWKLNTNGVHLEWEENHT